MNESHRHSQNTVLGVLRRAMSDFAKCKTAALWLILAFGVPFAQSEVPQTPAAAKYLKKLEEPIILRGDYFKAVLVAYEDFSKRLTANEAAANSAETPDRQLALLMSNIENYDIHVEQTKSSYVVQIGPTLRGDVPIIFGGGARYIIDRQTFVISKKIPLK